MSLEQKVVGSSQGQCCVRQIRKSFIGSLQDGFDGGIVLKRRLVLLLILRFNVQ